MLRAAVPADAPALARVHVASWRTTYQGIIPDSYLDAMDVYDYTRRWSRALAGPTRASTVNVVEAAGQVVGFASCGRHRDGEQSYEGELYAIYLLEEFQGRGHGRTLVEASATALAAEGMNSMVVWVLRDNARARRFYERLGGVYLRQRPLDFAFEISVIEVSYLWADMRATLLTPAVPVR